MANQLTNDPIHNNKPDGACNKECRKTNDTTHGTRTDTAEYLWNENLRKLSPDRRQAMTFLYDHLPESDLDCYPFSLFLQFADQALWLREQVSWCAGLDQEIFDHYVLFPRVNDEDLSFHRRLFFDALWPRIRDLSTAEERVLEVNRWCHEMASYQLQDDRTASPLTVFRNGSGRCGEESAFLVSALRSVGIAARQVYVPRWAHCDDNHAWVEALCDGQWRFLGACEPEPVLDRGWFNTAASRAILVHSRLFGAGTSPLHGELLCREDGVYWYNQTARYARVRTCTFRALWDGVPAPGTVFHLQLLNEAGFHTIATLTADTHGEACTALGLGDVHVLAILGDRQAEGNCTGDSLTLHLLPAVEADVSWTEFPVHAPKAAPIHSSALNESQRAERAAVLREGTFLRNQRLASFGQASQETVSCSWADLLQAARGNRDVIAAFLKQDDDPRREAMLRTLSEKDLRDVSAAVLEDHLQHAPSARDIPMDIYFPYVLCPRVEWEPLTPWRQALGHLIPAAERDAWRADPSALWLWLNRCMDIDRSRTYANLVWTPAEAWRSRRCDRRSLRILYVALLRTLGVPARLRPLDGTPEFWQNDAFHCVQPEETGALRLTYAGETPLKYRQHWTLSRRTETGWQLLALTDSDLTSGIQPVSPTGGTASETTAKTETAAAVSSGPNGTDDIYALSLPAGQYRLITTVRLPNGNQFAACREFLLRAGQEQTASFYLPSYSLEDMLYSHPLPVMPAQTPDGRPVSDLCRLSGRPSILLWLEEGCEPTEHVLHELTACQQTLESLPAEMILLVRGQDSLRHSSLSGLLEHWHGIRVLVDDWSYDLEYVARQLTCDPSTPPLAVVCDRDGRAIYGFSGYHVGSVELLIRVAACICQPGQNL